MKKIVLLGGLGGLVLFVWGFISWAILPWHNLVANKFTNEAAVSQVLKDNAPMQGVYYLPFSEQDHGPNQIGAFANVLPGGTDMNMPKLMGISIVMNIIGVILALLLIMRVDGVGFTGRVGLFTLVGLMVSYISHAPYWNWFGFSTAYVGVIIADYMIAWTLVGLAVAKFIPDRGIVSPE